MTTPFAVDLFPVAKGALFVQMKLGFGLGLAMLVLGLGLVVTVAYRPLVLTMSVVSCVLNADSCR